MKNLIYPAIWCNNNAREMADHYCSLFPETEIVDENQMVVVLSMQEQRIMLLNGGDMFRPNPSVSLMYLTSREEVVESLYKQLIEGGKELMPLDSYPFSKRYGWVEDRFGVSWQLYSGEDKDILQRLVPTLMFTGNNNGKAEEAINFYTSLFPGAEKRGILHYSGNEGEIEGNVQHAEFKIMDYLLMIMDSSYKHAFGFTEGMSLVVECHTQEEIDHYWERLTSDGGEESMCGWLRDKYGVSWQITPTVMKELLARSPRVMEVMMTMRKLDIRKLQEAAE